MKKLSFIIILIYLFVSCSSTVALGQWISFKGPEGQPVAVTLREDGPNGTVVEFQVAGYYLSIMNIDRKAYSVVTVPKATTFLEKGYPELPRVNRSIMIPDEAKMKFEIVQAEYETTHVAPIAPSKGSLLRSIDPKTVPYTFSDVYKTDTWWPKEVIELSDPFILRDIRGCTVRFNLFCYNAVREQLIICKRLVVRIFSDGIDTINVKTSRKGIITPDFNEIYKRFFLNFSESRINGLGKVSYTAIGDTGRMLIIAADDFYNSMIPLRDWRTRKGHRTALVKCSDVGTTASAVKTYIQNMYNSTGSITYILLVGDGNSADIPTKSVPYAIGDIDGAIGQVADPVYTKLAGSDYYPDAYISRFSAETVADVENQVRRTLKYETNPVAGSWFQKGTGIASDQGSPTDKARCDLLRSDLLNYGYTMVDQIYDPGATASQVTNAVNEGRSIINYIGHGDNTYWVTTGFSKSNVAALSNTNMLPFIISVACFGGNFPNITCFGEAWLRAGDTDNPKGAIASCNSSISQRWVEPTVAQGEAVDLLIADSKTTAGGLLFNGSCKMLEQYPSTGRDMFETWHIFGDAATHVWTKMPMNFTSVSVTDNGSSITVNAGVGGSTICVSSGNNGASFWQREDNVSSYTFTTSVRPLYITVTKHNYLPYTALTGGTFASNEYWFGNMKVLGSVIMNSGTTLTVSPSTSISFQNNSSLIVNGTLNAQGTSSQRITFDHGGTSGTWGGIIFNQGSGGRIQYCNIYHADNGIKCNYSLPNIYDNLIAYNTTGIYLNNLGTTTTEISNNIIRDNSYQGIYLNNSSPFIGYNTISGKSSYGIQCYNYSHPSIHHNTISGHTFAGIYLNYYSPAYITYWSSGPGLNKITGNLLGIYANYQCNAFVYYNSIYGNTSYEVKATQPVHINAVNNWWGAYPPNANEFYTDSYATIDYIPALQFDPLGEPASPAGGLAKVASYANNNNSILNSSNFFDVELDLALKHQLAGKYDEAVAIYDKIIKKELNTPKGLYSLVRLEECYWSSGKKGFIGYLNSVVRPNISGKDNISGITLELENHWLISEGKYQNALANLRKIGNDFSLNSEMYKYSLYNTGFIYYYYLNDLEKARGSFTELAAKYPNDPLVTNSKILLGEYNINTLHRSDPNAELELSKKEDQSTIIYELIGNYPNPFNPTTVISYQLPAVSHVKLSVYDVLGREVATLVDGMKEAGFYTANFDGSKLSSGVYFYKLQAGSWKSIKKMLLAK